MSDFYKLNMIVCFIFLQVMTFMGFSLTCCVMSATHLFAHSFELGLAVTKLFRSPSLPGEDSSGSYGFVPIDFPDRHSEEHALVSSIFGFMVVELLIATWSAMICLISDHHKSREDEPVSFYDVTECFLYWAPQLHVSVPRGI